MKRQLSILLALFAGVGLTAAFKRADIDGRLDAVAAQNGATPADRSAIAQWLNQNPFNNFNNWPNY